VPSVPVGEGEGGGDEGGAGGGDQGGEGEGGGPTEGDGPGSGTGGGGVRCLDNPGEGDRKEELGDPGERPDPPRGVSPAGPGAMMPCETGSRCGTGPAPGGR
jgi:hypothetical protein